MVGTHCEVAPVHGDSFMDVDEAARFLHVSKRTLARWRITGEGPAFVRIGPRRIGYRLSDSKAWAAARTFAHRADEMARRVAAPSAAA